MLLGRMCPATLGYDAVWCGARFAFGGWWGRIDRGRWGNCAGGRMKVPGAANANAAGRIEQKGRDQSKKGGV